MKKIYKLEDLDCANCAAKMERAVSKIEGVASINVSFLTQKMIIEIDDKNAENIIKEVVRTCKRIEPDCTIVL